MAMQVAVIGLGRFGSHIAETMAKAGVEVIAVDKNRDLVDRIRDQVTAAIAFDATDEEGADQGLSEGIEEHDEPTERGRPAEFPPMPLR